MAKYRKKPVVIEAILWDGKNIKEIVEFIISGAISLPCSMAEDNWDNYCKKVKKEGLIITTLEGEHLANIGDFIIKGIKGEYYPCKPDIFEMTYEKVAEMRKLSETEPLEPRICYCYQCDEEFLDDIPYLGCINKMCPNGCGCVLAWGGKPV